jgi:hypothetical protein
LSGLERDFQSLRGNADFIQLLMAFITGRL